MRKVEKYILTDEDMKQLKELQSGAFRCPDLKTHDCTMCPLFVDVNSKYGILEDFRCLSSLIDSLIWRNSQL